MGSCGETSLVLLELHRKRSTVVTMESSIPIAGAANQMRDGLHACRLDKTVMHPVQAIQKGMLTRKVEGKLQESEALFGGHMAMRMQMESAILSRHQRLPGLKSNFVGLTTLHNMDEDFGFEDVLDVPEIRENMPVPVHDAMEAKLRL